MEPLEQLLTEKQTPTATATHGGCACDKKLKRAR
jgi:hypothetical protein